MSPEQVAHSVGHAAYYFKHPRDVELARNAIDPKYKDSFDVGFETAEAWEAFLDEEDKREPEVCGY